MEPNPGNVVDVGHSSNTHHCLLATNTVIYERVRILKAT